MLGRTHSLKTHMLMLYVLLAFLSGIVVPSLGVILSLSGFSEYQSQRRQADIDALGDSLTALYEEDGRWDRRRIMDILRPAPQWIGTTIILRDTEGRIIFELSPNQHGHMRHGMMHFDQIQTEHRDAAAHGQAILNLTLDGKNIGNLEVRYITPSGRFERAFVSYLTRYTLAGAAVMIAAACVLGFFVAGKLSRPVAEAVERTRRIGIGEYDIEPVRSSGIREMDELSRGVEELGRSLAGQEKLRKRLMTDIVHELRTPITAARTQMEAMADGVLETTTERLALCVSELERLSGLVRSVEDLARIEGEAIAPRLEETDMAEFLSAVMNSFEPMFEKAGINLIRQLAPARARIDAGRFRHVTDNLLSNALRYTQAMGEQSERRVTVRLFEREGKVIIEVEDTGIGIAEADLPHIFERFYRADESRARVTGGRGVGLAIARAEAEAHGGTISAASCQGINHGSRFTVTLPSI